MVSASFAAGTCFCAGMQHLHSFLVVGRVHEPVPKAQKHSGVVINQADFGFGDHELLGASR